MKNKIYNLNKEKQLLNEDCQRYDLQDRLIKYVVEVIKSIRKLPKGKEYDIITYQLIKSASSVDANYFESQGAVSRADFANKVGIALKEMKESYYWVKVLIALQNDDTEWIKILNESNELKLILGSIYSKTSIAGNTEKVNVKK